MYSLAISSNNHNINKISEFTELIYMLFNIVFLNFRVVYIFGGSVKYQLEDITPTYLTSGVLSTLRQADYLCTKVLIEEKCVHKLSQMPVIITPLHFDRDPALNLPSCQRSIAIRTFITNDFMTGIPATPGQHIDTKVI